MLMKIEMISCDDGGLANCPDERHRMDDSLEHRRELARQE